MTESQLPPSDPKALVKTIHLRYENLSKRLQQVAKYALDFPDDMAIETIAVLSDRAGVQPSVLIRFAQAFGYSGFSEMQRIFKQQLIQRSSNYNERIRMFWEDAENKDQLEGIEVLQAFSRASQLSLEKLENDISQEQLQQAVALMKQARIIHITGSRRAFPVAAYLGYTLNRIEQPATILDGIAGMLNEQMQLFDKTDLVIAISFEPYGPETINVVEKATEKSLPVIALTDSPFSPIAKSSTLSFEIKDAEVRGFRSLTAVLCLAQTLMISLAIEQSGSK